MSNAAGDTGAANHAVITDLPTVSRHGSTGEQATFWRFNEAVTAADGRAFAALPFATRIEQLDALNASLAELNGIRLHLDSALPVAQPGRKRP